MNRIEQCLESLAVLRKKALVPFITAGDPAIQTTIKMMHALSDAGADIIELGMPFSDPMADGPTIQASSERSLKNGTTLVDVLQAVIEFRATNDTTPIVLMGYLNPIEQYGYDEFAKDAKQAGVDGLLIVDCPPEEGSEFAKILEMNHLNNICLITPTTCSSRIEKIIANASGYIYYVSFKGVTGANKLNIPEVSSSVKKIKQHTDLPVFIGFGVRAPETAQQLVDSGDGVIVGSVLVEAFSQHKDDASLQQFLSEMIKAYRRAIDNVD